MAAGVGFDHGTRHRHRRRCVHRARRDPDRGHGTDHGLRGPVPGHALPSPPAWQAHGHDPNRDGRPPEATPTAASAVYAWAGPGRSTTAWPFVPCRREASARAACSSGNGALTVTLIIPATSRSASCASRGPLGATYTCLISMPRSGSGGSEVIVASRPPLVTASSARAAPPVTALAARSTPRPPVSSR